MAVLLVATSLTVIGSIALEKLDLEIQAQEYKRSIFLLFPVGGTEVGTGHQEGLVYLRKFRCQFKGNVERGKVTEKCGLLVGIGYNRMDRRGEASKNADEDRSKSTQIGILCTRDWSGLGRNE